MAGIRNLTGTERATMPGRADGPDGFVDGFVDGFADVDREGWPAGSDVIWGAAAAPAGRSLLPSRPTDRNPAPTTSNTTTTATHQRLGSRLLSAGGAV